MAFINFSNHASGKWSAEQLEAARELGGEVIDIAFPQVDPKATAAEVAELAAEKAAEIIALAPEAAMIAGETGLVFHVISRLREAGVRCYTACSERNTIEKTLDDGSTEKKVVFSFVQFREI